MKKMACNLKSVKESKGILENLKGMLMNVESDTNPK